MILLSAPESVTVERLASRTNNLYGKCQSEVADVLRYKATAADLQIIEDQMQGYQARLDLWYGRISNLNSFWCFRLPPDRQ